MSQILRFSIVFASLIARQSIGDEGCSRPHRVGCHQPPNCAQPDGEPEAAPAPEGSFVTGPPRGEVAGESNSLGLRLGTLRFPEINIPLPTLQLPSLVKYRKDSVMHTESASAPFVRGSVAEFGLSPRKAPESAPQPETAEADETKQRCPTPCYECPPESGYAPQPCLPGSKCGEGCTLFQQNGDAWQNSLQLKLNAREQQIAKLESQVSELQKVVERISVQSEEATPVTAPSKKPRSREINPWSGSDEEVAGCSHDSQLVERQAEQIERMQAQLNELAEMQTTKVSQRDSNDSAVAEPLIPSPPQRTGGVPVPQKPKTRNNVFGKLGMALSRR